MKGAPYRWYIKSSETTMKGHTYDLIDLADIHTYMHIIKLKNNGVSEGSSALYVKCRHQIKKSKVGKYTFEENEEKEL